MLTPAVFGRPSRRSCASVDPLISSLMMLERSGAIEDESKTRNAGKQGMNTTSRPSVRLLEALTGKSTCARKRASVYVSSEGLGRNTL